MAENSQRMENGYAKFLIVLADKQKFKKVLDFEGKTIKELL